MKITAALLAFALTSSAQQSDPSRPAFEVASVKPSEGPGNNVEVIPAGIIVHNATVATCIRWAYGVSFGQIAGADPGGRDVLNSDRYEIIAKPAGPVPESQLRLMLQTLLADRFKLALHRETREMQTFTMVVDQKGPKFKESLGEGSSQLTGSKFTRLYKWTTMAQLSDFISDAMRSPVVDRTGLSARYDFSIDLTPYLAAAPEQQQPDIPAMVASALRDELGLKLTSQRAPVEFLVIDHLEKPSPN